MKQENIETMTKDELKQRLDKLNKEVEQAWNDSFKIENPNAAWLWYCEHMAVKEYQDVNREYKLVCDYELSDMDELDRKCRMTIEEFIDDVNSGFIYDDDGTGMYATEDKVSTVHIAPSDIRANKYRKDFNYICWYNK